MRLVPPILFSTLLLVAPIEALQIPFLATSPTSPPDRPPPPRSDNDSGGRGQRTFTLRHALHASTTHRHLAPSRIDYSARDLASISALSPYSNSQTVPRTKRVRVHRASSQDAFHAARRRSFARSWESSGSEMRSRSSLRSFPASTWAELEDEALADTLEWDETEIEAPDTNDVETLAAFGRMTSNAYTAPDASGWYDVGDGWNRVSLSAREPGEAVRC